MSKTNNPFHKQIRGRQITKLMARDGSLCQLCKTCLNRHIKDESDDDYITLDHIIPISKGGTDIFSNMRLTHQRCNRRRGNVL